VVETLNSDQDWAMHQFRVLDYVTNLSQVVIRYSIADQPNNSVTEGAVDAFRIDDFLCTAATWTTYGAGCTGSNGIPQQSLVSLPALGTTFQLDADNLGGGAAFMVIGLAQDFQLLSPFGFAANCLLIAQADAVEFLPQAGGSSTWSMSIPNNGAFTGLHIFTQVVEFGSINAVSGGGDAEIR